MFAIQIPTVFGIQMVDLGSDFEWLFISLDRFIDFFNIKWSRPVRFEC